jgi:tRNA-2-methylthio-N6-dimethylallyladenosine synthase
MTSDIRRVHIRTFGCQMNDQDSGTMLRLLESEGYEATDEPEQADVILLNTCSVREKPEQKVRSLLGRFRKLKRQRRGLVIGVAGCYAQQEAGGLLRRFPWVDLVMGPDAVSRLPALIADVRLARRRVLATEQLDRQDYPFTNELVFRDDRKVTAFVNIQKGCDNLCSFCIVPFTRGREVSRPAAEVVDEIQRLAEHGVREVTLLGQNVNSYGLKRSGEPAFHELIARVAQTDIARIRFTTSNPWDLDPGLVEQFATCDKLCSYFHLPVQAGADSMLQRMRRRHTRQEYLELVGRLRQARPDLALSTDIIVGFPGETEEEHAASLSLLEEVRYDFIYSFRYDPRPHTHAVRKFADDVPRATKDARLQEIQALQRDVTREVMSGWTGRTADVLVEGASKRDETWQTGRISQNWIVNFPGEAELLGRTIPVRIDEAMTNCLVGEPAARPRLPVIG